MSYSNDDNLTLPLAGEVWIKYLNDNEIVFYKNISQLSEKILKISNDDKLRRKIAEKGKKKYMKFFNSNLIASYIVNKTLEINDKNKYLWEK